MVSGGIKKVFCGILLWSVLSFSAVPVDRVVASVNSEPVLESDVRMGMLYYATSNKKQVLDRLVENMLLYQFLTGRGLQAPPELIEEAIQNIARANNTTIEGIARELAGEGLTLRDLRRFLEIELLATQGFNAFLEREVRVSELEIELERLKSGDVRVVREVELLVVDRKDEERLRGKFDPNRGLEELSRALGLNLERLRVERGELVEALDREVWKASPGQLVFAEDREHIYIARVVSQGEVAGGKSQEELRQEILLRKIQARKQELLDRLRRNSFIKIVQ